MRRRTWVQIAAATLSGNSLGQTVHTHRASVHQAAKLVAAFLRVARVTAGLTIGADFRFEVPGQSSVALIGGGRGQWLGGTMASAEHEPIMGVWGQSPQRGPGA